MFVPMTSSLVAHSKKVTSLRAKIQKIRQRFMVLSFRIQNKSFMVFGRGNFDGEQIHLIFLNS